ncbi:DUF2002 family protein [Parendozoicomonas haliclonae]|uniref:Uncharacterized protein n=1 Tax=Parendozoicomonas haliclonae TaxID=1960125 RepID=A0A1X7AF45_9GAMM|nr:DUF2002 family protein [Parendozoicomonas haliclonae]SMA36367.1 hypothetical protein EHSB41UT_00630 [Parendozoicomonas haliclonae]
MKYGEIELALGQEGLFELSRTKKAIGYGFSKDGAVSLYINTETRSDKNTLILHPRFESVKARLLSIDGIIPGTAPQRFSSNYGQFPKGETPAGKENYFGLPFGVEHRAALDDLLDILSTPTSESQSRPVKPTKKAAVNVEPPITPQTRQSITSSVEFSPQTSVQESSSVQTPASKGFVVAVGVVCTLAAVLVMNWL